MWSARPAPACHCCPRRGARSGRSRPARSVIICLRTLRLWQPTPHETQRRLSGRGGRAEETAAPLRSAATLACADRAPRHQLEGAWVPIAASVAGSRLAVGELRVRYLLLEAGGYSIIDRSNHVVDGGRYLVN